MFDLLDEILATMKRNKMRTFLTGFAVSWGIFMLIVLLGAGQGLQNGVRSNFASRAVNSVTLWPGWTSKPYAGYRADRSIRFDERTVDFVRRAIPEAEYVSASVNYNPGTTSYGENYGSWNVQACPPEMLKINFLKILKGRFINDADMKARRKVIVISRQAAETLFKEEDPLGKAVTLGGMAFHVAGVYDTDDGMSFSPANYIPLSVGTMLFDRGWGIGRIDFTVKGEWSSPEEGERFTERVRAAMGRHLRFDPTDTSAIYISDRSRMAGEMTSVFGYINLFLWVIGFACVMAGIVGVGNIMLVTVKERTREIGIRKALGATPWSVIKMVIIEAIFITTTAGYIGILMGIGLTELIAKGLAGAPAGGGGEDGMPTMFADPTVGLGIVFAVLALLVACGVVAGLIPSLKATRIRPIEAMRAD